MREGNIQKTDIKKIIKIVLIALYQILVIIALILTMVIVLQKVSNSNKSIGGYRIFRVITGSMEPEYEVGEVVISKQVDPNDIKIGDDIVYLGKNGEYSGKIIMHNVIGIDKNEDGKLTFHAKGLNDNSIEDPKIKEEQIYGIVKYKSAILTLLYNCATNIYSVFFIIIVLVLNVFISFNTPKKIKRHKIKQISNVSYELKEDFEKQEVESEIEEKKEEFKEEIDNNTTEICEEIEDKKYFEEEKNKEDKVNDEKNKIEKDNENKMEKKAKKEPRRKKQMPNERKKRKEE